MKISLIGPVTPYRGGISHFTTLLANQLIESGHDVQVISFKKQYPAWLYPGKSDKDYSPGREKVQAAFLLNPLRPWTWWKTVKAIRAFHPDEIIIPWWVTFWGPAFRNISKRLSQEGFHITYLIHNTIPHEARAVDRWLARRTLQSAGRYIVMTEKEKQRLLDLVPSAKNVTVVPHPIYQMFPPSGQPKTVLREKLGLPVDQPVLLFFGFIRPYKGLADLLRALHYLKAENQKIHLLIAGEFWKGRTAYDQQIKDLDLVNQVHIFDRYIPDDQVAQFFETADLFIAPYTGGTQSGALKSALGFGLPAVVTELVADDMVSSLTDRISIFPAGSPEKLAAAIAQRLQNPVSNNAEAQLDINKTWQDLIQALVSPK